MEKHIASYEASRDLCAGLASAPLVHLPLDLGNLDESSLTIGCHELGQNPSSSSSTSSSDPFANPLRLSVPLDPVSNNSNSRQPRHNKMKRKPTIINKYTEEMNGVNEAANSHPRSALIQSIQQENKHIRELQKENSEMRLVLEEHQNILELIMMKHRDQIRKLISLNKRKNKFPGEKEEYEYEEQIGSQVEQIHEMIAVMRKAAQLNENEYCEQQQIISSLKTENTGLREMLQIAHRSGSIPVGAEVATQTEEAVDTELTSHPLEPMNGIEEQTSS